MNTPLSFAWLGAALALSACTRDALATWVPELQLRLSAQRAERGQRTRDDERFTVALSAFLRFQPVRAAALVADPSELALEAQSLPCELGDEECARELAEVEHELVGVRLEQP